MKIVLGLVLAGLCLGPASWIGDQLNAPTAVIHDEMHDPETRQVMHEVWSR